VTFYLSYITLSHVIYHFLFFKIVVFDIASILKLLVLDFQIVVFEFLNSIFEREYLSKLVVLG